jgi:hypothetical protein
VFRADAAFAKPEIYEALEDSGPRPSKGAIEGRTLPLRLPRECLAGPFAQQTRSVSEESAVQEFCKDGQGVACAPWFLLQGVSAEDLDFCPTNQDLVVSRSSPAREGAPRRVQGGISFGGLATADSSKYDLRVCEVNPKVSSGAAALQEDGLNERLTKPRHSTTGRATCEVSL